MMKRTKSLMYLRIMQWFLQLHAWKSFFLHEKHLMQSVRNRIHRVRCIKCTLALLNSIHDKLIGCIEFCPMKRIRSLMFSEFVQGSENCNHMSNVFSPLDWRVANDADVRFMPWERCNIHCGPFIHFKLFPLPCRHIVTRFMRWKPCANHRMKMFRFPSYSLH